MTMRWQRDDVVSARQADVTIVPREKQSSQNLQCVKLMCPVYTFIPVRLYSKAFVKTLYKVFCYV